MITTLTILGGRASRRRAPARSGVLLLEPASQPPSAGGGQEGSSPAGVGEASPRRAPQDTAKSGPRPRQSPCPLRASFSPPAWSCPHGATLFHRGPFSSVAENSLLVST